MCRISFFGGHSLLDTLYIRGIINSNTFFTGWPIKNGHQRNWSYTLAGGINQKSVLPTFLPYIYRYWKIKQLLHLVAFNFSYGLQLIRSESTDFTNLTHLRYLQVFSSNHWNTWHKNILSSDRTDRGHFLMSFCNKYFSGVRKNAADILNKSDL